METQDVIKQIQPFVLCISFVGLYVAENWFPERHEFTDRKHDFINIFIGLLNLVFVAVAGYYFQRFIGWYNANGIGLINYVPLPTSVCLIVELLLIDVYMYWWHRANHTVSFFWYFHRYHHLDQQMNSTTGLRFHVGELASSYLVRMLVFPLLGFSLTSVLLHGLLLFPAIIFHHSNIRISAATDAFVRRFIVSPQMHRTHHSVVQAERDSNYSSLLSCWDVVFRTNNKTTRKKVKFGVQE